MPAEEVDLEADRKSKEDKGGRGRTGSPHRKEADEAPRTGEVKAHIDRIQAKAAEAAAQAKLEEEQQDL